MDTLISAVESIFFRNVLVLLGVVVAILSVWSARIIANRKQSADLVFAGRKDDDFIKGIRTLKSHYESGNVRTLAEEPGRTTDDAAAVRYVLNYFEGMSIGIQRHIYDEEMLKLNYFSTVVAAYKHAKPYIERSREISQRNTTYQEFEWMAMRWEGKPLKKKKLKNGG